VRRQHPFGLGLDLRAAHVRRMPRRRLPFSAWGPLTSPERHPLVATTSAVLHAAVLLVFLLYPRVESKNGAAAAQRQRQPVQLMYLPPTEPPKPKPLPPVQPTQPRRPVTPAFPEAHDRPMPENPSPTKADARVPEHDQPAAMSPMPVSRPSAEKAVAEKTAAELEEDAMVSEARRLFGPRAPTSATVAGPVQTAGLPLSMMSGGPRCASGAEAMEIEGPRTGVIEGIVRTESGGRPIPGAFLQMLGTGSATFADEAGHYRLTFDAALVGACRSQLVRVTAPGYRARTMILTYGRQSDNAVDLANKP
jgi:outer membrane biosynthesis protein TonB